MTARRDGASAPSGQPPTLLGVHVKQVLPVACKRERKDVGAPALPPLWPAPVSPPEMPLAIMAVASFQALFACLYASTACLVSIALLGMFFLREWGLPLFLWKCFQLAVLAIAAIAVIIAAACDARPIITPQVHNRCGHRMQLTAIACN